MNAVVLVLISLAFLEGCLFALAPGLVKRIVETAPERTLQLAGLIEALAAVAVLLFIYL
jgi:uncharacterized protein YjeT (DUF2065 family)